MFIVRRLRPLAVLTIAAAFVVLGTATLAAHEIGTTRVTARFPTAGAYEIQIVTDGDALLDKLEAIGGLAQHGTAHDRRFAALAEIFLSRVHVAIDDRELPPEVHASFTPAPDDVSPSIATITLSGPVAAGAHHLTWVYGWTFASYAFTVEWTGSEATTQWLEGNTASAPVPLDRAVQHAGRADVFRQYLTLGFTHIVPGGLDHMLFVLGLFLLCTTWRTLLWQVSAFTIAHTISLGLAMNGLVSPRPSLVEPLIALSIGYVGVENVLLRELKPWRVALVFAFGLLHGLGFAGALTELGLPRRQFATALVAFNLGVEAGQLFVIGAAMTAVGWWRHAPYYRRRVTVPVSIAIAGLAIYWTLQRL
jgi:hypothetical protein